MRTNYRPAPKPEVSSQGASASDHEGSVVDVASDAAVAKRKLYRQVFDSFDTDKSGTVHTNEMRAILKKLNMKVSEEELAKMMKDADVDGSGEIDFGEFINAVGDKGGLSKAFAQTFNTPLTRTLTQTLTRASSPRRSRARASRWPTTRTSGRSRCAACSARARRRRAVATRSDIDASACGAVRRVEAEVRTVHTLLQNEWRFARVVRKP